MGALTKGDRKASNGISLTQFHFETRFGVLALERTYSAVLDERYQGGSKMLKPDLVPEGMTTEGFFVEVRNYGGCES